MTANDEGFSGDLAQFIMTVLMKLCRQMPPERCLEAFKLVLPHVLLAWEELPRLAGGANECILSKSEALLGIFLSPEVVLHLLDRATTGVGFVFTSKALLYRAFKLNNDLVPIVCQRLGSFVFASVPLVESSMGASQWDDTVTGVEIMCLAGLLLGGCVITLFCYFLLCFQLLLNLHSCRGAWKSVELFLYSGAAFMHPLVAEFVLDVWYRLALRDGFRPVSSRQCGVLLSLVERSVVGGEDALARRYARFAVALLRAGATEFDWIGTNRGALAILLEEGLASSINNIALLALELVAVIEKALELWKAGGGGAEEDNHDLCHSLSALTMLCNEHNVDLQLRLKAVRLAGCVSFFVCSIFDRVNVVTLAYCIGVSTWLPLRAARRT